MSLIIEYWFVFVAIISVFVAGAIALFNLNIQQINAWLLWAVVEAERDLGSDTGRLKLSMVYGLFLEKFTWIAKLLPFPVFSNLVDKALVEMRKLLESNKAVANIVSPSLSN